MSSTSKFEVAAIAPELLKLGHTELYKFSKAWKRYVNLCKERNSVLPEGQKMVPATLVSCIDPDLLENLVCLDEIEGRDDADDVVDSDLEAWMKKSLGEVAKLSTPDDIAAMVQRKVRTNMQEKDSTMRINQLVSDYLTLSREQGWTLVQDQPKLAIKHLLSVVKPTQLKEVCENDLLLDQLQLRKDFYGFVKHLRKTAADADRWAATARTGRDTKSNDKAPAGGSTRSYTSGSSSGQRHSTTRDSTASPSKNKAPKCLNDKTCNKHGKTDYHYLKYCPHTSTETAAELLAKHRAARADKPRDAFKKVEPAKKVGRVLFKAKNTSLAKMARVEGKLDGKTIIGVLDTGATSSAVTRSFVTTLQDEGHLVSIQKMPEPFKYKLAHDVLDANGKATGETENEDFEITELCRLSPEWTLPHGPLCMRNTNFLIMEASMQDEELIIGLPELKKMGLDPVRIIDEVRENFHMTDFSDCGPSAAFEKPSKMGRMMLLRHPKCDISVNKHDPHSDEKEGYDASDDDSLPSLCSDSDSGDLEQHVVDDLELKLATYNYRIEHIAGELNVWTDLLTRWGAAVTKTTSKPRIDSTIRYGALFVAPLAMDTSNHDFPVAAEVLRLQKAAARNKALKEVPPTKRGAHGLLVNNEGKIWIPTNAVSMQVRLCVIAHCGRGGHRGHQVTLTAIQDHYYWKGMSKDVKVFVGSCFHCIASAPGETTPRPLGEALHATKPNEVIHFDYLYMGPSVDDAKYVLIVKDDYSNYVWLKQCKNADADSTAAVLIEWFAAFGVAQQWVSDQGSHFKNQVMTDIQKQLGTNHHFTTAYSPWANGTVEAVCKQTIRAARAMLSEMHLAPQEWPCVLPAIQAVLNNSPSSHRAGQTPLTAFTGHARDTPLSLTVLHPMTNQSLSFIKAQQLAESTKFALQVEQLHKEVTDKVSRQRRKQMEAHNANTHLVQPNFSPGDYVLRAEPKRVQHKLTLIWKGPYQVDKVFDNNTLRLNSLINGAQFITHVTRTRLYQDALLQTAEDLQAAAYFNNTVEFVVEKFGPLSIEKTTGELCVLTSWKGFDEAENTVEPIYDKWIDVPRMLNTHLQELADKGCELAIKAQEKIKEWENNPSDDLPGTTGDTYPDSYHYGSTNVHYL
jgi:Integrase core domain/Integrase zinc binding domain